MTNFLRNFEFERTSFWLGFLAGFLFLWLMGRLRPLLARLVQSTREAAASARLSATAGADIRLRNEVIRRAQSLHLAAPLFSLDEILLPPKLLASPPPVVPGEIPPTEDIAAVVIPYTPDWPEMASIYGAPTITLAEALQNGSGVVVLGQPGSGRTIALAQLAVMMARREPLPGKLEQLTPLLLHVADFSLSPNAQESPLDALIVALGTNSSLLTQKRLPEFLQLALENGRALLLLDGLDELPPRQVDAFVHYLEALKTAYPSLQIVATASYEYFDGLTRLGCAPLGIAAWNAQDRHAFIERWSDLWMQLIANQPQTSQMTDPLLLNAWLLNETNLLTPFELTLKVWSVYAGDVLGSESQDAIRAYLRRMSYDKYGQYYGEATSALEQAALTMMLSEEAFLSASELGAAQRRTDATAATPLSSALEGAEPTSESKEELKAVHTIYGKLNISPLLPMLKENGVLVSGADGRLRFAHTRVCAYLASSNLSNSVGLDSVLTHPDWLQKPSWDARTLTLSYFFASGNAASRAAEAYLAEDATPLHQHLLSSTRFLRLAPAGTAWRTQVMRRLVTLLQDPSQPLTLKARLAAALICSGTPGIHALLHQMSTSPDASQRQMAALCAGLYYDDKVAGDKAVVDRLVADTVDLLADTTPNVRRAACLGLVGIGSRAALDAVAEALLNGDDELRKSAAAALANHPEDGFPTLREGTTVDDILVRRAVIAGLQRVHQPWAVELLEKIQVDEEQWVVKNAATHALEQMSLPNPRLPSKFPPLTETPWLIAYAGELGIGVAPGKPAYELLLKALREGKEEQKLAALDYLRLYGDENAIPSVNQAMASGSSEVRDAAFDALWHLAASGWL